MKHLILLFLLISIVSCGSNNFAHRRYMKRVYVEKLTHVKSKKSKDKSGLSSLPEGQEHRVEVDNMEKLELKRLDDKAEEEKEIDFNKVEKNLNDVSDYSPENIYTESSIILAAHSNIENSVNKPEQTNHQVDLDNRPSNVHYWAQLSLFFGIGASSFSLISYIIGLIVVAFSATGIGGIIVSIIGILAGITGLVLSIIALTKAKYMTKMEKIKASVGLILSVFAIVASISAMLGFISSTW